MTTVDKHLVDQYRKLAATGASFTGLSIIQHESVIRRLIQKSRSKTVLDYGSGRGDAYRSPHRIHNFWGVPKPTLYDPAFPRHEAKPVGKFDAVLCSDVLEHIPEEHVEALIADLFWYAKKFVWASVCCRPAKKCFEDGTNMHVTVKEFAWWDEKMAEAHRRTRIPYKLVETP